MKFNIQKSILENTLIRSQSFLSRDTADITSQISLVLKDDILTVQATDYEIGIKSTVDNLLAINEGSVIVSGAKLISSVKALKSGEINIEVKNDIMTISQSRSKFKLSLFDSAIFPTFPEFDNLPTLSINSVSMIDSFKKVIPTIDSNNPKFELTGALMNIGLDGVEFASTDTRRLSIVKVDSKSDSEISLIVPKKAIIEMQKLFFDDVEIFYSDSVMVIKTNNTMFFTKLINGKFPIYQRIVPTSINLNINLQKVQMIESIKQIATISNEIKITFKSDLVEIESLTNDNNQAKTAIEIDANMSEDLAICVNAQYILDFLNAIVENDFTIGMNEENMPFVLECDNLKTIIMPIVQ